RSAKSPSAAERTLLERPHLRLVSPRRPREHGEVVAGEQHADALASIHLEEVLAVGAAHAGPFAVLLAGGDDLVAGLLDARMAVLAGDAHFHREVAGADQQAVDAFDGGDRLR